MLDFSEVLFPYSRHRLNEITRISTNGEIALIFLKKTLNNYNLARIEPLGERDWDDEDCIRVKKYQSNWKNGTFDGIGTLF